MSIIACPKCRRQYQIKGDPTGKSVKCASCQHVFVVGAAPVAAQPANPAPQNPAGPPSSQGKLFPESIPGGPDPLGNHVVHDPGFAEVDIEEIRRQRQEAARKNNKLADAYSSSSSLAKMEEEEQQKKSSKPQNVSYLGMDTLFGFEGRINRQKFWLSSIFYGMLANFLFFLFVFGYFFIVSFFVDKVPDPQEATMDDVIGVLAPFYVMCLLFGFLNLWVSIALQVKRYHDLGHSGERVLLGLIPIVGPFWVLIETGFMPGQPHRNEYGPDPLKPVKRGAPPVQPA